MRVVGQNSAEVADAVRDGQLEAGPGRAARSTTAGSTCAPAMREELLYLSADPERVREPMTIETLAEAPLILYDARWGADDPMRRQLRERAQQRGRDDRAADRGRVPDRRARPRRARPRRHVADRAIARPRAASRAACTASPFDPPLYETFAFITRRNAHLSPATRAFMEVAEKRVAALRRRLDAERDAVQGASNGAG